MEPVTKYESVSLPNSEETSAEVKAPIAIAIEAFNSADVGSNS